MSKRMLDLTLNKVREITICYKKSPYREVIFINSCINDSFDWRQIREVRLGLEAGLNVIYYNSLCYNWRQMEQIRLGLFYRIPVENFLNPEFSPEQMAEIRLGEAHFIDVNKYAFPDYSVKKMKEIRKILQTRLDVSKYGNWSAYNDQQILQIHLGLIAEVDVSMYDDHKYKANRMQEIRLKLYSELGLDDKSELGTFI